MPQKSSRWRKGISPSPVTLAIGDGANDVPMLQEAQVSAATGGDMSPF